MNTLRAGQLAEMLARQCESVCQYLLPQGRKAGAFWECGSVAGEAGKSLKVNLQGSMAGRWKDYAEGNGGDLIDLWAQTRTVCLSKAMQEAREFLGIKDVEMRGASASPARLKCPKGTTKATESDPVTDYLTGKRGLPMETIKAYRVAAKDGTVLLPSFDPVGQIQYIKYRSTKDRKEWSETGGRACLFGWQAIPATAREVVITEGEFDAMAWHALGFPALSVTCGAGGLSWVEAEYDRLARFDVIYLSFDMDDKGRAGAAAASERLGRERCRMVVLPHKDANECLLQGLSGDDMGTFLAGSRSLDPEELVPASEYADEVVRLFHPDDQAEPGVRLPWRKVLDQVLLRPGEVSLIAGVNGHGKSELAGHILLDAMDQGEKCCVASMEFKPGKWLKRLTRQAAATAVPGESYIRAIHQWYAGKLWAFSVAGTARSDRIMDVFRYAVRRYGVRFFVVDNLAKCGFAEDDYNAQKGFIDKLTDFARDEDCHVMLCVHMRKGETEDKPSGKMDVKGTGAITDMVDTVFGIWRNKPKEDDRRVAQQAGEAFDDSAKPDAQLKCHKQRNGDEEPSIALWFCRETHQFLGKAEHKARRYVDWSAGAEVHQGEQA